MNETMKFILAAIASYSCARRDCSECQAMFGTEKGSCPTDWFPADDRIEIADSVVEKLLYCKFKTVEEDQLLDILLNE